MIRLANAPCSWGVLEFDRDTATAPYAQVLDEIRDAGYAGTELGDWGFMPTDPACLADELRERQLELVGAFVPVALARHEALLPGIASALRTARLMRDAGFPQAVIVLSDDNASVAEREQMAGRIGPMQSLPPARWETFATAANAVARAVRDETGLRTVFHHHAGGYIETAHEVDELMDRTDPTVLGLCLDTGHAAYGGGDPLTLLERHAARVWHVHFKDCDGAIAGEARRAGRGYLETVRRRLFCELGAGLVDFRSVLAALQRHAYDGWVVVEQDVFPGYGTPVESARRSRAYLSSLGL